MDLAAKVFEIFLQRGYTGEIYVFHKSRQWTWGRLSANVYHKFLWLKDADSTDHVMHNFFFSPSQVFSVRISNCSVGTECWSALYTCYEYMYPSDLHINFFLYLVPYQYCVLIYETSWQTLGWHLTALLRLSINLRPKCNATRMASTQTLRRNMSPMIQSFLCPCFVCMLISHFCFQPQTIEHTSL